MTIMSKRLIYTIWIILIGTFAVLHALNLRADFPNYSPWLSDSAKYTDEGWWTNAAVQAHLTGNWHAPIDLNSAPAVPIWPFLNWMLFFFTGITIEASRGLAVTFFFASLLLSYLLLRERGPRWMALLALSFMVTSPFLFGFSRLAILEPMLITFTLAAMNLAIRLPRLQHPRLTSLLIGLLFTAMLLTKTSAVFLLPALGWFFLPLKEDRKCARWCALIASAASLVSYGLWMIVVMKSGALNDFKTLFSVNNLQRPHGLSWPLHLLTETLIQGVKVDRILISLTFLAVLGTMLAWRSARGRKLLLDPVFGASLLAIGGYIAFMVYHCYPAFRYYYVVTFFCFIALAEAAGALYGQSGPSTSKVSRQPLEPRAFSGVDFLWTNWLKIFGMALITLAVVLNGTSTIRYAMHPEYSFVHAAQDLTQFVDNHPNGNRMLVSTSGDQIALVTHIPTLCAPAETGGCSSLMNQASSIALYQPGWYAEWNVVDKSTLGVLHTHFSLEQVAVFHAFDRPSRNKLVLFKLHPLPAGQVRDSNTQDLRVALPNDQIKVPIQ